MKTINHLELYTSFLQVNDFDKKDYSQKRFKKALEESCEKFDYSIHQQKNSQTRLPEIKIISNTKENETI